MKFPIYLDCHSTTPLDPQVLDAMMPYLTGDFGNAHSRSHAFGWRAEAAVEKARERVASLLGASSPREIVFTSGATESNNLVLQGIASRHSGSGKHIVTSVIEHKCVLATAEHLARKHGFEISRVPVDGNGRVRVEDLEKAIRPDTILISVMLANNETGSIQPIREIGAIARARNVYFHTDAAQAVGKIPIRVDELNVDLLSLSAHKFYGPKGTGALFIRRKSPRVEIDPLFHGGGQENGYRSGTLNVPGIVGLGMASELCLGKTAHESERVQKLRELLHRELEQRLGRVHLNGDPLHRLPGSLNLSFPYVESDSLVARLKNIAVSSTSACMSAEAIPSYVLAAMGLPPERIHGSIRFGLGRFTTEEEIVYTVDAVAEAVRQLQKSSPLFQLQSAGS